MVGDGDTWQIAAKWLKGLDAYKVLQWFESRRYTTRLGDLFAACIEYVLNFSPLVQADPLYISQQVDTFTLHNQSSLGSLKKVNGRFGCFETKSGGVLSEVIVRQLGNDVLIKRFSSFSFDKMGRLNEVPDSEVDHLIAEFKHSPFEDGFPSYKEVLAEENAQGFHTTDHDYQDSSYDVSNPLEIFGLHFPKQNKLKWRLHYSIPGKKHENVPNLSHSLHDNSSSAYGHGNIGTSQNVSAAMFQGKRSDVKAPSYASNATISRKTTSVNSKPLTNYQTWTKSKEQPYQKPTKISYFKGETSGEFDFLFIPNVMNPSRGLVDNAWTEIHHWEVSVQFLLYTGPWEAFGLATPGSSIWNRSGKRIFREIEGVDPNSIGLNNCAINNTNKYPRTGPVQVFDACFIAPLTGTTLFDRKRRMGNQTRLCRRADSAAKISNLFFSSLGKRIDADIQITIPKEKHLQGPYDKYKHDSSIIRVIPRALAKGYLFFEPKLWLSLSLQRARNGGSASIKESSNIGQSDSEVLLEHTMKRISTSYLNPQHWLGWWVHVGDFAEFALSPPHEKSMWYIAPKSEWLSPVIISGAEKQRCTRVLNLVDFLTMSSKVADEAAKLKPPRMRRFLVVELHWDSEFCTSLINPFKVQDYTWKQQQHMESVAEKGAWVEVSRGFVVEDT